MLRKTSGKLQKVLVPIIRQISDRRAYHDSNETGVYPRRGGEYRASLFFNNSPATTPSCFSAERQAIMKPSPNSADGIWRELYQEVIFEEDPRTWPE